MAKKSGLGKGLEALFEENLKTTKDDIYKLDISDIKPNENQPRKSFNDDSLISLAESIKENGILQPILVRPIENEKYQIIAGERRFRAANIIGLESIPVIIKKIDDEKLTEIALIENLQREDLNPIEEAKGYLNLIKSYNLTQDEVSKRVGKSRSAVTNSIRLLNLSEEVKKYIETGKLSEGQARALLSIKNEEEQKKAAKKVIEKGMSVREIERMVNIKKKTAKTSSKKKDIEENINIFEELEKNMKLELKRNVKIEVSGKEKGKLIIEFFNRDELVSMAYTLSGYSKRRNIY